MGVHVAATDFNNMNAIRSTLMYSNTAASQTQ